METIHRVAIIGVTGFLGRALPAMLAEKGVSTTGISRAGKGDVASVDQWQSMEKLDFRGCDAVINLAGEPLDQRWTEANRRRFHESRIGVTSKIVEAIRTLPENQRPSVFINSSAVGIYGDRGDETVTEKSRHGEGYLADLCMDWEEAAEHAEPLGLRVVKLRTGVVLGRDGSAFKKLSGIFKWGIGGRLGSGKQWMPWIHVEDLRSAIIHILLHESLAGPVNATAPAPETNREFTRKLAAALHRPGLLPAPAFALRLILGEFSEALLTGQKAIPDALERDGFHFRYPILEAALGELVA